MKFLAIVMSWLRSIICIVVMLVGCLLMLISILYKYIIDLSPLYLFTMQSPLLPLPSGHPVDRTVDRVPEHPIAAMGGRDLWNRWPIIRPGGLGFPWGRGQELWGGPVSSGLLEESPGWSKMDRFGFEGSSPLIKTRVTDRGEHFFLYSVDLQPADTWWRPWCPGSLSLPDPLDQQLAS